MSWTHVLGVDDWPDLTTASWPQLATRANAAPLQSVVGRFVEAVDSRRSQGAPPTSVYGLDGDSILEMQEIL
jgi:hypothetical protein